jgi:hypothetical protein
VEPTEEKRPGQATAKWANERRCSHADLAQRSLGVGLLVSVCMGVAVRVVANELKNMQRGSKVIDAVSKLRRWADVNKFTILLREAEWESPFLGNGGAQVVFRVVVQDRSGQTKWARVLSGRRVEVTWIEPESFASSRSKDDPLWDQELDA